MSAARCTGELSVVDPAEMLEGGRRPCSSGRNTLVFIGVLYGVDRRRSPSTGEVGYTCLGRSL